jgi:hypothetical protein
VFARALKEVRPSIEGQVNPGEEGTEGSTTQENEMPDENALHSQTPRSTRSLGGGLSAKPKRMSHSPFKQALKPFDPSGELQENINPFKRTGLRRSPIASQVEPVLQENINPFQKRGLRRSPISSQPLNILRQGSVPPEVSTTPTEQFPPRAVDAAFRKDPTPIEPLENLIAQEEPPVIYQAEDPATVGLKSPTRQEILVSTAKNEQPAPVAVRLSRNARTLSEEPELPPTPVELGIPDPVVTTPPLGIHDTPSKRARRNKALGQKIKSSPLKPRDAPLEPAKVVEQLIEQPAKAELDNLIRRRKSARFLVPLDPHAAKKKERDRSLKELLRLQADLALATKENERLRTHSNSKRSPPSAPKNSEELLAMLLRAKAPETSVPAPKPASILTSISSFLPFSSRRRSQQTDAALEKRIPSHLPAFVDNPLPYLQAFSPLTYTSTISLLPSEITSPDASTQDVERPVMQQHLINASHSSGLFNSRILMIVDSLSLSISSLEILKLDPAAEKELGAFVRQRAHKDATLNRDVGVICWAMGRWVETSILRARFWCTVESDFGTAEARAKSLQLKKKRKLQKAVAKDDTSLPVDRHGEDEESKKQTWSKRQLLPHIGRTAMELATNDVELRIEWKIGIDWTGEAESSISASSRLPKHCKYSHLS